jgi:ABC-type Fe3+ transport system substrate-binding protein
MSLVPSRDGRLITDWLAQGKFALSVLTSPSRTGFEKAKAQGLPVDWFGPTQFKEGVNLASGSNNIALINRAPHPNAAKLFVNWFLSREGQIFTQKVGAARGESIDSLRIDIPKDDVPPDFRRQKGVKYFDTDRPEWMDLAPITKLINEVWKPG